MSPPLPRWRALLFMLLLGTSLIPAEAEEAQDGSNMIMNGDFNQPINTDRKRGRWTLLGTPGGTTFELMAKGFATADGALSITIDELALPSGAKPAYTQLSQLIPALTPGQNYRLSLEAKCSMPDSSEIFIGVGVVVAGKMEGGSPWQPEQPTAEWTPISYEFTASELPEGGNPAGTRIDIRLQKAAGVVSFRNVKLEEL